MQPIRVMIILVFWVLNLQSAAANSADPLFQDQSTLRVEITAPLGTLVRERSETEYLPGVFSFKDANGEPLELDIQLRARGNFRHRNCDFPPVTLNFRKSQVEGTLFDQQDKLKMVTRCKDTLQYEQSVVREYLAYQLLNSVSDFGFRVRLLQVTWVDSDGRMGRMARSAFLIEHKNRLADRIGMSPQEVARVETGNIQPEQLNLASMFQYLIGNVDFSPIAGSTDECCHNYALFGKSTDSMVAIPFDFDLAGIVNAPYAATNKELGVERLGQRAYRGYCVNNGYVAGSISEFREARETLYALVSDQKELETSVRERITSYMDEFYDVIDDPQEVERKIAGNCR